MRFRYLRIAWTVVCGIAAVLLIALWIRSYQTMNQLRYVSGGRLATQVASYQGRAYYYRGPTFLSPERQWVFASEPINVATGNPPRHLRFRQSRRVSISACLTLFYLKFSLPSLS